VIAHSNYLIGGTQNGKWLKEEEVLISIGKPTKFIGFDSFKNEKPSAIFGTISELMGCGAYFFQFGETEEVPKEISFEASLKPILAIGANAKWNPLPRLPKKLDSSNKTYQKFALDFLKTKGIKPKNFKFENAFTIDLEGDGSDEVFLEATNYKDKKGEIGSPARAGSYSFVLMRKIINGKPQNILIGGEFHPKKPEFEDYITESDLSAFADLNGDGKIELILENLYSYGGVSTEIYESQNNILKEVLAVECGD
jgi:hypothetical protein